MPQVTMNVAGAVEFQDEDQLPTITSRGTPTISY